MVALGTGNSTEELAQAWAQVAELTPKLALQVELQQHSYRGEDWLVLSDRMSGAHFRCDLEIEPFLRLLDGKHSVGDAARAVFAEDTGNRVEIIQLLAALDAAQLLIDLAPRDSGAIYEQQRKLRRRRWLQRLASPLAIQVPLLDPDHVLERWAGRLRWLLTPSVFWAWLALVVLCGMLALDSSAELALHWDSRFLDPGNLLLLWLLYPLVKGLHELGHGITTRAWGGEVHEMGVMLLVFTPVPYVDASASTAFTSRHRRMVVAAAGIMVELLLAAVAFLVWNSVEPGLLRDACFNVMVIGGLSTLLFNGNPLLRFDGYYVLTDLLEIPNLRTRANDYLGFLLKRHVFRLQAERPDSTGPAERGWLLAFAILSGLYRLIIGFTIALFIAGRYFIIGALLAIWLLVNMILLPLGRVMSALWQQAGEESRRPQVGAICGAAAVIAGLALFVVPMSTSTRAEGILNLAENTELRIRAEGFVTAVLKQDGDTVREGDTLVLLENPELRAEVEVLAARHEQLKIRYNIALSQEPVEQEILKQEIVSVEEELEEAREEMASLAIVSPTDGVFSLPGDSDLPGRFLRQGDLLGHVLDGKAPSVRVVLPESAVDRVVRRTRNIEVRLASRPGHTLRGDTLRDIPKATRNLPSALLGSREGGDIAVDARDQAGLRATRPVFELEISLPEPTAGPYLGQRAFVRFEHVREPLGSLWIRQIRQLLLERLGI
ncbi:MAG: hypothetical protein QNI86_02565 [Halieaceae bacterium]|nr:hypothetical protein [Halieaceae bacterium]